ncbi:hypothetical protein EZ456_20820 [Pedobacter psychrodurus]|uniref:Uncharacterized protein n=1 Tax=Pedobacter psychrodurus TaxID=2530456 RepID=A0A4R0PHP1_9SPHI|nr:hypothetical protein [Pedobacter psychrodurus]TCD18942.1 hypothetical protein EZ456_20820 [Pedobacter psychrodurus]
MNYKAINTHHSAPDQAFEALCNQLFERWLRREHGADLIDFVVVNGDGGDGGVEAYGEMKDGKFIGLQAKYFTEKLSTTQVTEIEGSIATARNVRKTLKLYIVCIPRSLTNIKIINKKTNATAKATDYSKTQGIITRSKALYKGLKIVFWGEHELNKELERFENIGTRKLWFDKSVIDFEKLVHRLDLSMKGWLLSRYVPDLHVSGFIQERIEKHLYSANFRTQLETKLKKVNSSLQEIQTHISVIEKELNQGLGAALKQSLNNSIRIIDKGISAVNKGKIDLSLQLPDRLSTDEFYQDLNNIGLPETLKNELQSLQSLFANVDFREVKEDIQASKLRYLIFSGNAGTGKTHALCNATEQLLKHQYPAVIIQAKDAVSKSLGSILKDGFSSFSGWEEEEILSALEALAHACEVDRAEKNKTSALFEPIKTVICLDGIDEVKRIDWERWVPIINSLPAQIGKFPRLQFVISCRNSFGDNAELSRDFPAKFYKLPPIGDVDHRVLFKKYVDAYNAPDDQWIKLKLKNILAVKLFCTEYKDQRGQDIPLTTSLTKLIKLQLLGIQKEINEAYGSTWREQDQVLDKTMTLIALLIFDQHQMEQEFTVEYIAKRISGIKKKEVRNILNALCEHGILLLDKVQQPGTIVDEYFYKPTYESILEFILANQIVNDFVNQQVKQYPEELKQRNEIIDMAAEILMRDHGITPGTDALWGNLGQPKLREITLKNIPEVPEIAETYIEEGKLEFKQSFQGRDQIFEDWIMQSLGVPNAPFDTMYLHGILAGYSSTFQRDLLWSGPDYAQDADGIRIADHLIHIELELTQKFDDLPLIFAWSLTSVDNLYRDYAKTQLTNWAYVNLAGFQSIMELLFNKYDPQLDEDLALILMGVASLQSVPTFEYKNLSEWILEHVFAPEAIIKIKNATIRHGCRSFLERALMLGQLNNADLKNARPPYVKTFEYLPLDIGKATGSEDQRKPIVGDLAWYVIKYSYEKLLNYGSESQNSPTKKFLTLYNSRLKLNLGPLEFAISAAIAYIKSLGWEDTGLSSFTGESHGSLSEISTYPEKYTWLAVNHIKGYLADYLPFQSDFSKDKILDYGKFLTLKNPANDIKNKTLFPEVRSAWILPNVIASKLLLTENDHVVQLKAWVESPADFELKPWYEITSSTLKLMADVVPRKKWLVLDNDTTVIEPNGYGRVSFKSKAFLIKESQFDALINTTNQPDFYKKSDFKIDYLHATPDVDFYISPIDAIWMKWIEEDDPLAEYSGYDAMAAISKVTTTEKHAEQTYIMPAKQLREWLAITSGNGKVLLNNKGDIVGVFSEVGESFYDHQQMLLVDQTLLNKKLKQHGYKIVWSVFTFKTAKFTGQGNQETYHQDCELSLVWKDGNDFKQNRYHKGYNR